MQIAKQEAVHVERTTQQQKMEFQTDQQKIPQIQDVQRRQDSQSNKGNSQNGNTSTRQQQERFLKAAEQVLSENGEKIDLQQNEVRLAQHEKTNRMVVTVVDKETEEVVREIPSEKILDMLAKMWDAAGLFVDEVR